MKSVESTPDMPNALPEAEQDRLARILDDYLVAVELGAPIGPDELLGSIRTMRSICDGI